jgi:hypothetical protein
LPIPDTSIEARDSRAEYAAAVDARILKHFQRRASYGSTDDEIEVALRLLHQTASACRRNLVKAGHIRETDGRRKTRTGRNAVVWKLTRFTTDGYSDNPRECRHLLTELLTWPRRVKGVIWPQLPPDLQPIFDDMKRAHLTR